MSRSRKILFLLVPLLIVVGAFAPAANAQQRVHVVKPGETCFAIGRMYGVSCDAIASTNGLRNPSFITVGQRLVIPNGSGGSSSYSGSSGNAASSASSGGVHIVQRGETLASISRRYGKTIQAFVNANGIRNPNMIYAGQRLIIPGGGGSGGSISSTPGWTGSPQAPSASRGGVHVVQRGETCGSIGLRYGVSCAAIATASGLRNPSLIYPGQRLVIPSATGQSQSATHQTPVSQTLQETCGFPASIYEPRTYLDYDPGFEARCPGTWAVEVNGGRLGSAIDTSNEGQKFYTTPGCYIWGVSIEYWSGNVKMVRCWLASEP